MNKFVFISIAISLVASTSAQVKVSQNNNRIYGGEASKEGEFPFLVSLTVNGEHICGGFIFNQRFVVTAASCVEGYFYTDVTVVAGQFSLIFADPYEKRYQLVAITIHESYNPDFKTNNIALLETSQTIATTVGHVEVGYYNEVDTSTSEVIAMGWGATQEGGIASIDLRKATLNVMSSECLAYGSEEYDSNYMICAGSETASPCAYDEGSPLFQNGYVIGIVSSNQGCKEPFLPTLFTRVTAYYAWLLRNAGQQPPTTTTTPAPVI